MLILHHLPWPGPGFLSRIQVQATVAPGPYAASGPGCHRADLWYHVEWVLSYTQASSPLRQLLTRNARRLGYTRPQACGRGPSRRGLIRESETERDIAIGRLRQDRDPAARASSLIS